MQIQRSIRNISKKLFNLIDDWNALSIENGITLDFESALRVRGGSGGSRLHEATSDSISVQIERTQSEIQHLTQDRAAVFENLSSALAELKADTHQLNSEEARLNRVHCENFEKMLTKLAEFEISMESISSSKSISSST
jgi:hypothetical protein